MLTCIACSKQLHTNESLRQPPPEDDDNAAATPSTKQAIKALKAQIKDMAVKASGAYKNCKPCSGSDRNRGCADSNSDSVSGRFHGSYRRAASSSSTPRLRGKELEAKLNALSSGSATPTSVSGRTKSLLFMEEDEAKEWVAQVEPGVLITFISLPQDGNDLKKIRFSREIFNKWQAQKWWEENNDKVVELYNVQRFSHREAPLPTPPQSEHENSKLESAVSPVTPPLSKEHPPRHLRKAAGVGYSSLDSVENHKMKSGPYHESAGLNSTPKLSSINAAQTERSSLDASAWSSSSRNIDHSGELSGSNASDLETEWVEQDDPGVYITVRALPGGGRELRRVRFSREKFVETQARVWWEENRARIQQQYL